MATKDFDYENFAQNLAAQAQELVPQDFNDVQKQYVINTLGNFALLSGQTLAQDPNLNFNAEQSITITQIIAEWSFHKSVDVIRSGIPQQYWDPVMQQIAYTIFEIAKQTFSQGLPHDKILELIEHHVKKKYNEAITELKNKGAIDEGLMEYAMSQSNMDKMAQEMQQGQIPQQGGMDDGGLPPLPKAPNIPTEMPKVDSKVLKLATVAMLLRKLNQDKVQTILNKFDPQDAEAVIKYMRMPDLIDRVGGANALRALQEIKTTLPRNTQITPNKVILKLKKFASKYSSKDLDTLLIRERMGVKRLVFNAMEGKYYDKMPPRVASIVATHLTDSV
jgi:hypothetical protein